MNSFKPPRMRTVHEAAQELRALDPDTAVSEYHIRQLALRGTLPIVRAGRKKLLNLDLLLEYLADPTAEKFQTATTVNRYGVRPIM